MIPIKAKPAHRFRYPAIIAGGFFLLIFLGAILLSLPISSRSGTATNFLDALFTSTSATCVTGLVVQDTYLYWSVFGQCVILALIQIGGLGFMTILTLFSLLLHRKIGLKERGLLQESMNTLYVGGIVRLVKNILIGTFLIEGMGAALLAIRFIPQLGWANGIFSSVFHSVSAFCNAGFDLMGRFGAYSSLTTYQNDPLVILTISLLIIIGGIGFLVWSDFMKHGFRFHLYSLHSKIVLSTTGLLLLCSTILFLIFEGSASNAGLSSESALMNSFFSAVTPRTAGFNSVDTAALSGAGTVLTVFLMFVGGSPGSTAGGIKTSTFAVLLLVLFSTLRGEPDTNTFGRRLEIGTLKKAVSVIMINLILAFVSILLISSNSGYLGVKNICFEVFSAIGTVGMSTGITRDLNSFCRLIIIMLMYCGRIGSLSLALLFTERRGSSVIQKPIEKIVVG